MHEHISPISWKRPTNWYEKVADVCWLFSFSQSWFEVNKLLFIAKFSIFTFIKNVWKKGFNPNFLPRNQKYQCFINIRTNSRSFGSISNDFLHFWWNFTKIRSDIWGFSLNFWSKKLSNGLTWSKINCFLLLHPISSRFCELGP